MVEIFKGKMETELKTITSKTNSYEIVRKLGEGFTGEVYLVKDNAKGEHVALKLLNPEAYKEGQLKAFKREFMLLSDLHHPHVCKVFDFGLSENTGRYFFTLELVQGMGLYQYIEKLSIEEIEEIFVQIIDGLGFIHSAGLIHYDIKGQNILVTQVGNKPLAKIVDFGLAAPSMEQPENIAGTIRYMSPEMITKSAAIDYRADLYAAGIMFYRMLAGKYPEQGANVKEALAWHTQHTSINTQPLKEKNVPDYLIQVIENLTRKTPMERFSSAAVIIKFIELHSGKKYRTSQKKLVAALMEEGPLVARDALMQKLRPALTMLGEKKKLAEDVPQTLVVTGCHGLGKSRMIKEARYIAQIAELDAIFLRGEVEGQSMDALKKACGFEGVQDPELAAKLIAKEPFCLMFDDLDRASQPVKDFIAGFANSLYSSKFLGKPNQIYVIVTMTTEAPKDPMPVAMHFDVDREILNAFTEEDTIQYLRLALGESDPSPKQVSTIMKFSGGVPGLVRTAIANIDSPKTLLSGDVNQLFVGRIKKLGGTEKLTLGFIGMAERPLKQETLISLTGTTIETALSSLQKDGYISFDREAETYGAASGAIMLAVKEAFEEKEQKEIAAKLLAFFEKENPEDVDSIVRFASICAKPEKVAGYLISAAEKKEAASAIEDALRYFSEAVQKLQGSDKRVPDILRKLARYEIFKGRYESAKGNIEKAVKLSTETQSDLVSLSWIGRLSHRPDEALIYIEKAIASSSRDGGDPAYLRVLNEKGYCYIQMGKCKEAAGVLKEAYELQKKLPEDKIKLVANSNYGLALSMCGELNEAVSFYKEKRALFADNKQLSASILSQLGYVYQQAGQLTEALETFKESWGLYSEIGDLHSALSILNNIVCICQSKALFTDAMNYVTESIKIASSFSSQKDMAQNFLTLGTLYVTLGLPDVARRYLNEGAGIFQKTGDKHMQGWSGIGFAYLYRNMNRTKEALAHLENVVGDGKANNFEDLVLWGSYDAGDILVELGDAKKAEEKFSNIKTEWPGPEAAKETNIKVELLRAKIALLSADKPADELRNKLNELATLANKQGLRELESEIYYCLSDLYKRSKNELETARCVANAKAIIDDIAGTLSEEYRESFLKQKFRKQVFEDSVRLKDLIDQVSEEHSFAEEKKEAQISKEPNLVSQAQDEIHAETSCLAEKEAPVDGSTTAFGAAAAEPVSIRELIGQSEAIKKVREIIAAAKDSHAPVLICGEEGTEKDVVVELLRSGGAYKDKPLKSIDASALTGEFMEHELFGKEGAAILEEAGEGILDLKHIEKIESSLQKQLAKVFEQKMFRRLSDKSDVPFKARVFAECNVSFKNMSKAGLSKDLLKFLSEVVVELPPLKERKTDIPLIAADLIARVSKENSVPPATLEPKAVVVIMQHSWPRNITELEEVIRNVIVSFKPEKITDEMVKAFIS